MALSLPVKLVLSPLLVAQAVRTRARMPKLAEPKGRRAGVVGSGPRLRLLIAGDSSAVGVGVVSQRDALAGHMTRALAAGCGAEVHWQLLAKSGLTTAQTLHLLQRQPPAPADIAVIVTGVNDVVDQIPSHHAVAARESLANWLRNMTGVQHVVFAPLPPVRQFPGLPQPLRWVAGRDAERHDRAMAEWSASRNDVSHVAIDMNLDRGVMASDGFHPGEPVYRRCGTAIARHIATHLWPHLHKDD